MTDILLYIDKNPFFAFLLAATLMAALDEFVTAYRARKAGKL